MYSNMLRVHCLSSSTPTSQTRCSLSKPILGSASFFDEQPPQKMLPLHANAMNALAKQTPPRAHCSTGDNDRTGRAKTIGYHARQWCCSVQ